MTAPGPDDIRVDPLTGAPVVIAGHRQHRPNLPETACPFCPGGLEAPEHYDVRWIENRWPPMAGGRCEVLLYAPEHAATLASLGVDRARRVVDLWAERSAAQGARHDVQYVLVFENRGRDVGATIDHPHGQLYAFQTVPPVPLLEADRWPGSPSGASERLVAVAPGWQAWVPVAPVFPIELLLWPDRPVPDLPSLDDAGRDSLAQLLVDVIGRVDAWCGQPAPYMLTVHQRPFDGRPWPVDLHVHLQSPWRSAGVLRYVAAGELGSGVYFNPVVPEDLARALREQAG